MKKILIILLLSVVLTSCDENGIIDLSMKATFESSFPKRGKDMTLQLGDEFSVKNNNDTIDFKVLFEKEERINYIINKKTNDTVFSGIVNKYRGLYYFNKQKNDTTFWIYAVKIENGTIKGLGTELFQMAYLNEELDKVLYGKQGANIDLELMIKTINNDTSIIKLTPEKKVMKIIYRSILDSLPSDTIIDFFGVENTHELKTTENTIYISEPNEISSEEIIVKLYPNPANDYIIIETKDLLDNTYRISNTKGQIVLSGKINSEEFKIDVSEFNTGTFFINVDQENGKSETLKFIVE